MAKVKKTKVDIDSLREEKKTREEAKSTVKPVTSFRSILTLVK